MKFVFDLPEYQNIHVEVEFSFWTNKPTLQVNGSTIPSTPGDSRAFSVPLPNGKNLSLEFRGFTLDYQPRIVVNGKKLISIAPNLKWYQWLFASIPVVLILIGGAIGGICAFIGVNYNFRMLRGDEDGFVKMLYVLIINLLTLFGYSIVSALFRKLALLLF